MTTRFMLANILKNLKNILKDPCRDDRRTHRQGSKIPGVVEDDVELGVAVAAARADGEEGL